MITKDEIEAKADEFGLHASDIERDYIFGWLLAGIYRASPLREALVLKGGNCFRKAYFPHTRFSKDLDFSSTNVIQEASLTADLNNICDFVQEHTGVTFEKDRNWVEEKANSDKDRRIYEARLYFKDFYGNPSTTTISVHLDVTEYDRIFLPVQNRSLIHPYSDSDQCSGTLRCHKLEELVAAKLKCLVQRRHSLDLYDYVYSVAINRDIEVNRAELLQTFLKKAIFEPGAAKRVLLDLPLEAFRVIWHKYLVCPAQSVFDFDSALTRFKEHIQALFAFVGFGGGHHGTVDFYPSNRRDIILQALSNSTLLDLKYDGFHRLVEPFSLKFERRKDGVGQEYLFGYDRTGGKTGPGPKKFLPPKIQSLTNTNQLFEPAERSQQYFATRLRRTSMSSSRVRTARVYIVECSYCRKRFPRKQFNARLRLHKDKYGNRCAGRSGYIAY